MAEVYGLSCQDGCALAEDAPLSPANPHAASKAAGDIAVGEMTPRGLRTVGLWPCNHTGAGEAEAFAVSAFARQVALDRWLDFLDVADCCAGYVAVLRQADRLAPGAVFNLANGTPSSGPPAWPLGGPSWG